MASYKDEAIDENHLIINQANTANAVVILAHGAGAGMQHQFFETLVPYLTGFGINVVRFNFPYMQKALQLGKKRPPDKMEKLLNYYQQVLQYTHDLMPNLPLYIGGKSMGGRVAASLLAAEDIAKIKNIVKGAICLGYPFHPIGKPEKLRLAPLQQNQFPVLVIQGQNDKFGSQIEIGNYSVTNNVSIQYLAASDHDLKPLKSSGFSHEQHLLEAAQLIRQFIQNDQA